MAAQVKFRECGLMSAVAKVKMRAQSVMIAPLKLACAHIRHYISEPYLYIFFVVFSSMIIQSLVCLLGCTNDTF